MSRHLESKKSAFCIILVQVILYNISGCMFGSIVLYYNYKKKG